MIAEDTLKALLARRTELKNLDYKALMNWATASNEEKCELVKDILAMMNTQDGGQIAYAGAGHAQFVCANGAGP